MLVYWLLSALLAHICPLHVQVGLLYMSLLYIDSGSLTPANKIQFPRIWSKRASKSALRVILWVCTQQTWKAHSLEYSV